jgi:hypothetical protein
MIRIELYDYVLVLLYLFLIIQDFQWSEYIYDNVVEECIHGQEGRIDRFIKRSQEYLDANFKDWIVAIKDFLINTIRGVILPMIMDLVWRSKTSSKAENLQEPPVI